MHPLSFYTDPKGFPRYESTDDRWVPVGVWFMMELRNSPYQCLDLLAIVDDVVSGREARTQWEGEAFDVVITAARVSVVNTILDNQRGEYALDEVRAAAEDYWRYLSGSPRVAADLKDWEKTWSRTHPYRGRLF
ncbi:hypothetical protein [Micromonospora endolithica]|uniref:Uncharacterized protein n=1 Tax=Micromonospora endolithica TaxID=230091 RepID=A0A3A9ZJD7_9ACTN|nr:hypothetical protein [Micromonospora endolithica]RKN48235.1 hypothetical protein D7223_09385 [Micromonospora endolithica]TWJ24720.1 hypothetical protein JD76_04876 [Micromonospora endolithica]